MNGKSRPNGLNGTETKQITIARIMSAVARAREKHPHFTDTPEQVVAIAAEEFGEWAKEVNERRALLAQEEALDLIAVLVRFLEND